MVQYRDIIQKQQGKFDKKQDRRDFVKAVITDALGNTTGAGSVWADRNTRRVWIQENGSASLSQVPCYRIKPDIGLGVIVGFESYSTVREVLSTDKEFLGQTNTTGTSYESPDNEDLLPGGRLQLWLDPRLIQPLATYPYDNTSLSINVIAGDYPYAGARVSFAGQVNYSLAAYQPAGPNEHCLVGLYLDSANSLQVIAGGTVSTALDAPEPVWPAGAFRLSVVDLDDTQTSLSLADDIRDRRMAWADEDILGVALTGAIITGDATPKWAVLARGAAGQYVTPNSATGLLEWRNIPTVGITEFLYHDASPDIATYFQLKTDVPTGGAQTLTSAAVAASNTLIFNFATNANQPNVDFINDGVWHLHLHAQKSGPGTKNITLKIRVYTRTSGGVETQIGTGYSESTANLTTSQTDYEMHLALGEVTVATTDRIVLKIYADISGSGANPTVTLTMEGTTDSRLEVPALVSGTGGDKGWPAAGKAMINNVEYDTIQLAIDAMAAGDIIKVGQGTDAGGIVPDTAGSIVGLSPVETIITASANDSITVNNSAGTDNLTLENLTLSNTGAGTSVSCIQSNKDGLRLNNLDIKKVSGTPTNSTGVSVYGGSGAGTYLLNCRVSVTTGTNKYGVYMSTGAANCVIEGGEISAATADISLTHASNVLELRGVALLGGVINATTGTLRGWAVDDKGRDCGEIVKNTSGATVNRGDVGYLDNAGAFKTTTTANNFTGEECIVTAGGANNSFIFVRRTGNATVNYTGAAPNAGDYLVTSTSAGLAQAQATMRPEIFAVCLAAGSGGVVEVLLLCNTVPIKTTSATTLYSCLSHSSNLFVATINGAPGATSVVYNAPSSGNANCIKPGAAGQLGKAVLWNTTRNTGRLIDDVNTGTSTITTVSSADAWANGDTITIESQTVTTGVADKAVDIDLSQQTVIPILARSVAILIQEADSGGNGGIVALHPMETFAASKQTGITYSQVASIINSISDSVKLINRLFAMRSLASGTGTASTYLFLVGYEVAAP